MDLAQLNYRNFSSKFKINIFIFFSGHVIQEPYHWSVYLHAHFAILPLLLRHILTKLPTLFMNSLSCPGRPWIWDTPASTFQVVGIYRPVPSGLAWHSCSSPKIDSSCLEWVKLWVWCSALGRVGRGGAGRGGAGAWSKCSLDLSLCGLYLKHIFLVLSNCWVYRPSSNKTDSLS